MHIIQFIGAVKGAFLVSQLHCFFCHIIQFIGAIIASFVTLYSSLVQWGAVKGSSLVQWGAVKGAFLVSQCMGCS